MNAILLIVGLGLLVVSGPPLPGEGPPAPEPAPVRTVAAPDPLQLDMPGLPPPAAAPLPASPGKAAVPGAFAAPPALPVDKPAPVPVKQAPPSPERLPAFRPVKLPPDETLPAPSPRVFTPHQVRRQEVAPPAPAILRAAGVQTPAIALDKVGPASVRAGEPFVYEIILHNVGPVPAQRLVVEDELPPGTRVVNAEPPPLVQGNRLAWQLEGLAPGEEKHFHVQVQPAGGGAWQGTATVIVSASRALQTSVHGATPQPAPAGQVFVDLRGPESDSVQGHPLAFDMRVTNKGSAPLAGVILHAHLPPGLEHFYGSDIELNLDPLKPGETRTEKLEVIAVHAGRHVAEVSVRAANAAPMVVRAAATVRDDPVLGIRLIGPREAWTTRATEYRIEVTNRAPTEAREVVVMEHLPPGFTIVSLAPGGAYDQARHTLTWKLGSMLPGQKRVLPLKLLTRATGPALHDIVARTDQGHVARLQTVLKFWPARATTGKER